MSAGQVSTARDDATFRHEALLYSGDDGFLWTTVPFLTEAVDLGEPALVVISERRIRMLRTAMGHDADQVMFADMAGVGRNPARIIPAWRDFLDAKATDGRRVRGIGEPVWSGRSTQELVECQRHESLLNVAFGESTPWWLLCPYDVEALPPDVIAEARRSHPYVRSGSAGSRESPAFVADAMAHAHTAVPLPEPLTCLETLSFEPKDLAFLRSVTLVQAGRAGLDDERADNLVLAVHEMASNSIRHGGGRGRFRLWLDTWSIVAEISDSGVLADPLAGRRMPDATPESRRGLWIANHLCDLVQQRQTAGGSVVRLHVRLSD